MQGTDTYTEISKLCHSGLDLGTRSHLYKEVTLSGCMSLCSDVHSEDCSAVVFMSTRRSCILTQAHVIPEHAMQGENCHYGQIYKRNRKIGRKAINTGCVQVLIKFTLNLHGDWFLCIKVFTIFHILHLCVE